MIVTSLALMACDTGDVPPVTIVPPPPTIEEPTNVPDPTPTPTTPQGPCLATGRTLSDARSAFSFNCPTATYRDCDPIGEGWTCSSEVLGGRGPKVRGNVPDPVIPTTPVTPPVVPPTPPVVGLRAQAETASAQGWTYSEAIAGSEGGYLLWQGGDLFSSPGSGVLSYSFNIEEAGRYRVVLRSRITGGTDHTEQNDVFLRQLSGAPVAPVAPVGTWFKVFQSTLGEWVTATNYEYPAHAFGTIVQDLQPGIATLELSGRSNGFAIDYIELIPLGDTPVVVVPPPSVPETRVYTGPGPHPDWADSYSANGKCYIASTFDHGAGDLIIQTPAGPKTAREVRDAIGPGPGIAGNPRFNDINCGNGPANNAGDEDPDQCPGRVDMGKAGCYIKGPTYDLSVFGSASAFDVLGLHFDVSPDRDDITAAVAGRVVSRANGIEPVVVLGTSGLDEGINMGWFDPIARPQFDRLYPGTYYDYNKTPDETVGHVAERYLGAIQSGGKVRIAEGGPSDFTFRVVQYLQGRGIDTKSSVTVVQHSAWNEAKTIDSSLAYVKANTNYIKIPDGNYPNNGSADFYASKNESVSFRQRAAASAEGESWNYGFSIQISDARRVDFSDAVEVLYLVGDTTTNNIDDFANKYF